MESESAGVKPPIYTDLTEIQRKLLGVDTPMAKLVKYEDGRVQLYQKTNERFGADQGFTDLSPEDLDLLLKVGTK